MNQVKREFTTKDANHQFAAIIYNLQYLNTYTRAGDPACCAGSPFPAPAT